MDILHQTKIVYDVVVGDLSQIPEIIKNHECRGESDVAQRKKTLASMDREAIKQEKLRQIKENYESQADALQFEIERPTTKPQFSVLETCFDLFVESCCERDENAYLPYKTLIEGFTQWCDTHGYKFYYAGDIHTGRYFVYHNLRIKKGIEEYPRGSGVRKRTSFVYGLSMRLSISCEDDN